MDDQNHISTKEALCRVGAAIYGSEWIGSLTQRELWLLERYVDRYTVRTSILPGKITFTESLSFDPELTREVNRARDRRDWSKAQRDRAFDWLEVRLGPLTSAIDGEKLARELAKELSHVSPTRSDKRSPTRMARAQPSRERASMALQKIYSDSVPAQSTEPNKDLCKKVGDWLKANGLPSVKDDTILRAAGRRK